MGDLQGFRLIQKVPDYTLQYLGTLPLKYILRKEAGKSVGRGKSVLGSLFAIRADCIPQTKDPGQLGHTVPANYSFCQTESMLDIFTNTASSIQPLRFYCVIRLNPGLLRIWPWQSDALTTRLDLIHARLDLIHTRLDLIHSRLYLIHARL